MNARFPVKVDGQWREAEIRFATEREVRRLAYWRLPRAPPNDAPVVRKMFDAVEFARLASNRWRYYHKNGDAVTSFDNLAKIIRRHPNAELAMVLIARPTLAFTHTDPRHSLFASNLVPSFVLGIFGNASSCHRTEA